MLRSKPFYSVIVLQLKFQAVDDRPGFRFYPSPFTHSPFTFNPYGL